MVPLTHLWLPILLAAVLVFVASSLVHMLLKWHNADYRPLPNEAEVLEALRKGAPAPGQYLFPHCADHRDMNKPEMQKKYEENPLGLVWLAAPGRPRLGKSMGFWFLFNVLVAFCVAYLTSRTVPPGAPGLHVFRVAGTAAFLAYAAGTAQGSIWMGKPWIATWKEMADGLLYALVSAAAFAWLWPN